MLLQINRLFFWILQELSGGTILLIAIIKICLPSSIMTLGKFLQDAAQFVFCRCLVVKGQIFQYYFTLES